MPGGERGIGKYRELDSSKWRIRLITYYLLLKTYNSLPGYNAKRTTYFGNNTYTSLNP